MYYYLFLITFLKLFPAQDSCPDIHLQKSSYTFLLMFLLFRKDRPALPHHNDLPGVPVQNVLGHQNHIHFFLFYMQDKSLQNAAQAQYILLKEDKYLLPLFAVLLPEQ